MGTCWRDGKWPIVTVEGDSVATLLDGKFAITTNRCNWKICSGRDRSRQEVDFGKGVSGESSSCSRSFPNSETMSLGTSQSDHWAAGHVICLTRARGLESRNASQKQ